MVTQHEGDGSGSPIQGQAINTSPDDALRDDLHRLSQELDGASGLDELGDIEQSSLEQTVSRSLDQVARRDIDLAVDRVLAARGLESDRRRKLTAVLHAAIADQAEFHGTLQALLQSRRERKRQSIASLVVELKAGGDEEVDEAAVRELETGRSVLRDSLPVPTLARWAKLLEIDESTLLRTASTSFRLQHLPAAELAAAHEESQQTLDVTSEAYLRKLASAYRQLEPLNSPAEETDDH